MAMMEKAEANPNPLRALFSINCADPLAIMVTDKGLDSTMKN